MTADVLQFGDMVLRRKREQFRWGKETGCPHRKLTLDDEGDIVSCDDCGKQVSAYWALRHFVEYWENHKKAIDAARERVNQDAKAIITLRAAKLIQEAWRSRTMIPTCPHCHAAILPEDGFGGSSTNREIELRRRQVKRSAGPTRAEQ